MVVYPVRTAVIERLARKRTPDWAAKAATRSQELRAAGKYIKEGEILPISGTKASNFWGTVKGVLVTAQYGKCAYCETKLEVGGDASIQWDLEHFRPKDDVTEWRYNQCPSTNAKVFKRPKGLLHTGKSMPAGYYLLAYHLGNYLASCKTCNTIYKSTYFPIHNNRISGGTTPEDHASEGAYLIYPLGDSAEDPRDHIYFYGVEARARNGSVRGQLIIDFFCLNREGLQRSRAEWLVDTIWDKLKLCLLDDQDAIQRMTWMLSYKAPHANCTSCFYNLALTNKAEAENLYIDMQRLLRKSPSL